MISVEKSARTQEEAIEEALNELNASISDVDVKVLEEGSKGLFGLFGSKLARVLVTLKNSPEDDDPLKVLSDKTEKPAARAPKEKPVREKAAEEARPTPQTKAPVQTVPEVRALEQSVTETAKAPRPEPVRRTNPSKQQTPAAVTEPEPVPDEVVEKAPVSALVKPEIHILPPESLTEDTAAGRTAAFVSELTKLMGVDVTLQTGVDDEGNVYVSMSGDTLGILIGLRGETLDALQYLTSLKVNRGQENYTRVTLDTENYRAKREDTLIRLANRMANRAVKNGRKVIMEPMNPYERRIIHSALQSNAQVETHSEGEEPNRHVVITVVR